MEGRPLGDERSAVIQRADKRGWVTVLVAVVCALALSACGGSGSSGEGTASAGSSAATKAETETSPETKVSPEGEAPTTKAKTEEPSAAFAGKGKNGELATVGKESTAAEREAASKVVEESFKAAESEEWAAQCATFSLELAEGIEKSSKLTGRLSCLQSIERLAKENGGPPESPMTEPLAALRVNGSRAFAFFSGVGNRHFVIPLARESGQWKLASLGPEETP